MKHAKLLEGMMLSGREICMKGKGGPLDCVLFRGGVQVVTAEENDTLPFPGSCEHVWRILVYCKFGRVLMFLGDVQGGIKLITWRKERLINRNGRWIMPQSFYLSPAEMDARPMKTDLNGGKLKRYFTRISNEKHKMARV